MHPRLLRAEREGLGEPVGGPPARAGGVRGPQAGCGLEHRDRFVRPWLIKARNRRRTQPEGLAKRLGIKEQQIQRYEADRYVSASYRRLQEIVRALGVNITKGIRLAGSVARRRRRRATRCRRKHELVGRSSRHPRRRQPVTRIVPGGDAGSGRAPPAACGTRSDAGLQHGRPDSARGAHHVPALDQDRLDADELRLLIRPRKHFALHAQRQTGKTSALLALRDESNAAGKVRCVYVNVVVGQNGAGGWRTGMRAIFTALASGGATRATTKAGRHLACHPRAHRPPRRAAGDALALLRVGGKPIVLLIVRIRRMLNAESGGS